MLSFKKELIKWNLLKIELYTIFIILINGSYFVSKCQAESSCWKRKYYVSYSGRALNATVKCDQYYQWTVTEYCCYDRHDHLDSNPYCCYSETYKLLVAIGIICALVIGVSFFLFTCWLYNIPHNILRLLTCGKFSLNDYMKNRKMTGGYVDPSFYAFPEGSEFSHYPLRPLPPRIFYPVTAKVDFRSWSSHRHPPLFLVASRQFERHPYSARPNELRNTGPNFNTSFNENNGGSSRRSSSSSYVFESTGGKDKSLPFTLNYHIDEVDAASELLEALKYLEEKGEKGFNIAKVEEETQNELDRDLENEQLDKDITERQERDKYFNYGDTLAHHSHNSTTSHNSAISQLSADLSSNIVENVNETRVGSSRVRNDPLKLTVLQLPRTGSGTTFRRGNLKNGLSTDSTASLTYPLESIREESKNKNLSTSNSRLATGNGNMKILPPGYIPEEDQ